MKMEKENCFVKFEYTPQEVKEEINLAIKEFEGKIEEILSLKEEERQFENTVRRLAVAHGNFFNKCNSISFLYLVHPNKEIRDAAIEAKKEMERSTLRYLTDVRIYICLKTFSEASSSWKKQDRRLYEKMVQDLERNGMQLGEEERKRVLLLKTKLTELGITFNKNVYDVANTVSFSKEELEGMPANFLEGLSREGEKYVVTLKYPHVFPVMTHARRSETRKKMQMVFENRCADRNVQILHEILDLRKECAALLGFESDSHFVLDTKLAKTRERVLQILEETNQALEPAFEVELREMLQAKRKECEGSEISLNEKVNSWDVRFLQNLVIKNKFNVDSELVREYFPFCKVIQGVLLVYSQVLSLRFEEEKPPVWHETVRCYSVHDLETNMFFGLFYLDLFPREGLISLFFQVFKSVKHEKWEANTTTLLARW